MNLDFADVRSVMSSASKQGVAMIGLGESDTRNRAEEAVIHALENPLRNRPGQLLELLVLLRGRGSSALHVPRVQLLEARLEILLEK